MAVPELQRLEGKYEILEKLAEGGMGAVYKIRHRLLEEVRVVKVIRPTLGANEEVRKRFLREARSAVRLRHPNLVLLHDFNLDEDGTSYMVMEFIDGVDLGQLFRAGKLPNISLVLEVGRQSLRALNYLHKHHFVHRDISPDNLMLTRDVEGNRLVKLIDLGIAKPLEAEQNLTGQGLFLGKIRYASPEQFGGADGNSVVDQRSDLYSMGIVLYELLTGDCPIAGKDHQSILAGHLFRPPKTFEESDPGGRVPQPLREVVMRALEKDPEARFATAKDFSAAVAAVREGWSEAEPARDPLDATVIAAKPAQRPGSTQNRLDDRFPAQLTPPPFPAGVPPAPSDPSISVEGAASLARSLDQLLKANRLVSAAEALASSGIAADEHPLLGPVARRLEERREEAASLYRRAAARSGETRIADLEEAADLVQRLLAIDAEHPEGAALGQTVEAALAESREALAAAIRQIETATGERRLTDAESAIVEALRTFGASERLEELRSVVAGERAAVRAAETKVRELLGEARLDEAAAAAESAVSGLGDVPELLALRRRVGVLVAAQKAGEEQARRQRVQSLLTEAEAAAAADDLEAAVEAAAEAVAVEGEAGAAAERLAEYRVTLAEREEAARKAEEARRARLGALRREAQELASSGELAAAVERLEQAVVLDPDDAGIADELRAGRSALEEQREAERLERERAARVEALAERAADRVAADDLEGAIAMLDEALTVDPGRADLAERRQQHAAEIESRAAAERKAAAELAKKVDRLASRAERELEAARYDAAIRLLEQAAELDPTRPELAERIADVQGEAEAAAAAEREEELDRRISQAEAKLKAGEHEAARALFEEAQELDPDSSMLAAGVERCRLAAEEALAAAHQLELEAEVDRRLAAAEARFAAGDHAAARDLFQQGLELDPENRRGQEGIVACARAVELAAAEALRERVDRIVSQGEAKVESAEHLAAAALFEEALALDPERTQLAGRIAASRAVAEELVAAERQERAVSQAAGSVGARLQAGDLEAARGELAAAEREHGADDRFAALDTALTAAVAEVVRRLLGEAREAIEAGDFDAAAAALAGVSRHDPESAEEAELRPELEAARRIEAAARAIEGQLAEDEVEAALAAAERAIETEGSAPALVELRQRAGAAVEARRERLEHLKSEADRLLEDEELGAGLDRLREAMALDPGDRELARRAAEAERQLTEPRRAEERALELESTVQAATVLLDAGKVRKAERQLSLAETRFGPAEELAPVRAAVEGRRVAASSSGVGKWVGLAAAGLAVVAVGWLTLGSRSESPAGEGSTEESVVSSVIDSVDSANDPSASRQTGSAEPKAAPVEATAPGDPVRENDAESAAVETIAPPIESPQDTPDPVTEPLDPQTARITALVAEARNALGRGDRNGTLRALEAALSGARPSPEAARLAASVATSARTDAVQARDAALAGGAAQHAPTELRSAESRYAQAERERTGNRSTVAAASYWESESLYRQAAVTAGQRRTEAAAAAEESRRAAAAAAAPKPAEPVATPTPSTGAGSTAASSAADTEQILATIQALVAAHNRLDLAAVRAVWPSLSGARRQSLESSFSNAKSLEMSLSSCRVELDGGRAVARCQLRQTYRPKRGMKQSIDQPTVVQLSRDGGRWVVVGY